MRTALVFFFVSMFLLISGCEYCNATIRVDHTVHNDDGSVTEVGGSIEFGGSSSRDFDLDGDTLKLGPDQNFADSGYDCNSEGDDVKRLFTDMSKSGNGAAADFSYERRDDGCLNVTVDITGDTAFGTAGSDSYSLVCCPTEDVAIR